MQCGSRSGSKDAEEKEGGREINYERNEERAGSIII